MKKLLFCAAVSQAVVSLAFGNSIFWNPTGTVPYAPVGGDGQWRDVDVWWNPSTQANFTPGVNTNQLAYFEGSGIVGGVGHEPARMFVQNTTAAYNFTGTVNLRLPNNNTGHALEITNSAHNITIANLGLSAGGQGNRSILHNGSGLLTLTTLARQFGGTATHLAINGSGNVQINGVGNMGGTMALSGTGRVTYTAPLGAAIGTTGAVGFTSVVLNSGELLANGAGSTNFTWNGGTLVYQLSNTDNSANRIALGGTFTRGSGTEFVFDFGNTGIQETYELVVFTSTNFDLSDFTAINSPLPGEFSFGTTTINDVQLNTLLYTIPEPSTYAAIFGLLALGFVAWRRRRKV